MRLLILAIFFSAVIAAQAKASSNYDCFYNRCGFGRNCLVKDSIRPGQAPIQIAINRENTAYAIRPTEFSEVQLAYDGQYGIELYSAHFELEKDSSPYSGTLHLSVHRKTDAFTDWEEGRHLLLGFMVASPSHDTFEGYYVCGRKD